MVDAERCKVQAEAEGKGKGGGTREGGNVKAKRWEGERWRGKVRGGG